MSQAIVNAMNDLFSTVSFGGGGGGGGGGGSSLSGPAREQERRATGKTSMANKSVTWGSPSTGNCSIHGASQAAVSGAVHGGVGGAAVGGPAGAAKGAGVTAVGATAAYSATCFW